MIYARLGYAAMMLALGGGCAAWTARNKEGYDNAFDADGDGAIDTWDCAPTDPELNTETMDVYVDADEDGYGDTNQKYRACAGYFENTTTKDLYIGSTKYHFSTVDGDCNDEDVAINPGAAEICDSIDNDCDDLVDDQDNSILESLLNYFFADVDNDGYGDPLDSLLACFVPAGYVEDNQDCKDNDASINPDGEEVCDGQDNDCDGTIDQDATDAVTWYTDADGDGYGDENLPVSACEDQQDGTSSIAGDCDDDDPLTYPGAEEIWYDGIDQACDGGDDYDQDRDGDPLLGFGGNDCDDTDPNIYGAEDVWYDGIDSDCAGDNDYDADADGYCRTGDEAASGLPGGDCDDEDATINPGASETWYDGIDSDCVGDDDYDQDGDGHQALTYGGDDCDDEDSSISPSATEIWYDGIDQNCDGLDDFDQDMDGYDVYTDCDDEDSTIYPGASETWYDGIDSDCVGDDDYDQDGDGDRALASGGTDCDDTDTSVYGSAPETCDGTDNNCSGNENDATDALTWYADADGDTYGDAASILNSCLTYIANYVSNALDCNDALASIYPGATETYYNGIDEDCYGDEDEYDMDLDGYEAEGYGVGSNDDCEDLDEDVHPGATEVNGDGLDNDCDPSTLYYLSGDYSLDETYGLFGESILDYAGLNVAISSDLTGDADDDLVVAAPGKDDGATSNVGGVYVVPGADALSDIVDLATSGILVQGVEAGDNAGRAIATGELTGDTNVDLVVSSYNNEAGTNAGVTYVYEGPVTVSDSFSSSVARLIGEGANHYSGDNGAVVFVGDSDGDGNGEVFLGATGAFSGNGGAYLVNGPLSGDISLASADCRLSGETSGDNAGISVGSADLDGDGLWDLLVGASAYDTVKGVAYLLYAGCSGDTALASADARFFGENNNDGAGRAISNVGDLNGDGIADVAIGAPGVNSYAGRVYVMYGSSSPESGDISLAGADATIDGENAGDYLGFTPTGGSGGDVDGDGSDDLVLGAEGYDTSETDAGIAYLLYGPISGALTLPGDAQFEGVGAGDNAGYSTWLGGDPNGDGLSDFLIGAYPNDDVDTDAGAAYLVIGQNE